MSKPIIEVRGLGKVYRLGSFGAQSLREEVDQFLRRLRGCDNAKQTGRKVSGGMNPEFWALRDVAFTVAPGEVVGIIGRNGAGKSTLLKILARITEPTTGEVLMRGRVASLLEVGTGFHPELSGRDNIYLNGAILGMKKGEIARKFDEIVEFAEVGQFIDTPVKRYSSGMYVRLAFAVAAHLEPEILIVDEVLAVGDQQFQEKCLGKMKAVSRSGRTVLFVSHNMIAVQSLCSTGIVLSGGKVAESGAIATCVERYLASASVSGASWTRQSTPPEDSECKLCFEAAECELRRADGAYRLDVRIKLRSFSSHAKAFLAVDIHESSSTVIMQALPRVEPFISYSPDGAEYDVTINLPPLIPGKYALSLWVGSHNTMTFDEVREVLAFEISESPTLGRTFPHSRDRGFIVPDATIALSQSQKLHS